MSTTPSVLAVPGGALFTLRELRASSSPTRAFAGRITAQADMADLRTIARLHHLRMPWMVHNGLCGIVGTLTADDNKALIYAVEEWATAFNANPVVVEPGPWRDANGKAFVASGWALMQGSVHGLRFTVGGKLVKAVKER